MWRGDRCSNITLILRKTQRSRHGALPTAVAPAPRDAGFLTEHLLCARHRVKCLASII